VIEWLLISVGIFIGFTNLGYMTKITSSVSVFLIGIPVTIFFAFLLKIIMTTLGGKGKYFEGLASMAYGLYTISLGVLIASPFFYLVGVGPMIAMLILVIAGSLSLATFYRAVKELFSTDMITTWIGIGLSTSGIVLGFYLTMVMILGGTPEFFSTFKALGMWKF
jgi:hypothetical protein